MTDQYFIPLFVAGSLLLTIFAFFLVAYLLVQKNKQNKYMLEKRQMVFDHQNNILRTKLEEQENTMDQISKELHDNIKSVLGFAQMNMYKISELATDHDQILLLERTTDIVGKVVDDLHNVSHSLNSNFVKYFGLIETLTKDLESIQLSKNITSSVEIIGNPVSLTPEKELHIFRIAQEAIQNCLKHAKATNISFVLTYEPQFFTMKITDNGVGFDKSKIHEMKGLGFLNMFQRSRYVHGLMEVQTAPRQGSTITLTLNLRENGIDN
jgi:two-component system NarL family sensor kinase